MVINNKVIGSGVSAALVTVIVWVSASLGHTIPPEVATAIVGVVAAVVGFLVPSNQITPPNIP